MKSRGTIYGIEVEEAVRRMEASAAAMNASVARRDSAPASEHFAERITRAVDAFGARSATLTQARHRENVERAHARYQNRKPKDA